MIKRIVLIGLVCLLAVLISSCGDNRTTTGYSRGDSAGDGEPESSTSSDQSNSSTSVASSSSNEDYVDKYADLLAAYNTNSGGLSKSDWGKNHYCAFGQIEGRTSSGLSTASCSTTSASSSSSASSVSSNDYEDYVNKYPDLLSAYNASGGGQSKSAWGQSHYTNNGQKEGRTLSGSASSTTSTTTASPSGVVSVTDVRSSLSLPSLAPTGTVWKPISEGNGKLVILTPASWSARSATIRNTDGSLVDTGTNCRRTNGNRCTYRFSRAGGGYPNPCVLRLGTIDYLINNPVQRIN